MITKLIDKKIKKKNAFTARINTQLFTETYHITKHRDRPRENAVQHKHETKNVQSFKPRSITDMNILILKNLSHSVYLSSTPQASYVRKLQKITLQTSQVEIQYR